MQALAPIASLALVAVLSLSGEARAEDEPTGLRVSCDDGARSGAAVLVEDPRTGQSHGAWLLTALHVLRGCRSIMVSRVTCEGRDAPILAAAWGAERPVELVLFRGLDVAAIVVPSSEQVAFEQAKVQSFRLPAQPATLPPWRGEMELLAKAGANICPLIPLERRDAITALAVFGALGEAGYERLLGTLANTTELVSYESTAVPGTSGGPVRVQQRPREVLAVHLGGDAKVQWGVRVDRALLLKHLQQDREDAYVRLDEDHPKLVVERYAEPRHLTHPEPDAVSKVDLSLHRNSYSATFETSTPIDPFGAYAISPQLSWSHLWVSTGVAFLNSAFGTRLGVGGNFGRYRGVMKGPGFEEEPRKGSVRVPFAGAFLELDAELHLARLSPVQYVVSLGLRGGPVHQRDVEAGATTFVWGPAIAGQVKWGWFDRFAVIAQLRVSVDHIPVTACQPNCAGPTLQDGQIWDAWAGLSMGLEMRP